MDIMLKSVKTGEIPQILKMGWITPIWKGDDLSDPINFRTISLTSHLSKILERLVRIQMTDFLTENKLIEDSQHGSRGEEYTHTTYQAA